MRTEDLIEALAADLGHAAPATVRPASIGLAVAAGGIPIVLILLTLFHLSPHFAHPTPGWLFSTAVTMVVGLALGVGCISAMVRLARPDSADARLTGLLVAPAILAAGVLVELAATPKHLWSPSLWGQDPLGCFLSVACLSLPVLIAGLSVLRRGATTRPASAGAAAGLLAGAVASVLYLAHCPEASLLFTAAWHVPAVLAVAALGAGLGCRLLAW